MSTNEMLERLMDEHRIMLEAIQGFQAADFEQTLLDSPWSVRDVFAHLAILNGEAVRALKHIAKGRAVSTEPGETRPTGDERGVSKRRTLPLHKVMEEFRRSHRDLVEAVKRMPEAQRRKNGRATNGMPIDETAIITRVVEHYARHRVALVKGIGGS